MLSLVVLAFISQFVMADSLEDVVITFPDEQYEFGSEVEVTIHVFDLGQTYDVQEVLLVVGETGREVGTTREGVGLFKGTFEIQEEDLSILYNMEISTKVKHEDVWVEPLSVVSIQTVYRHAFGVEVVLADFTDHWLRPGDTVGYDVLFTYMDEPVDPDPGSMYVELTPPSWSLTDIQQIGKGLYTGSLTVPQGLMKSETGNLAIRGDYTWGNFTDTRSGGVNMDIEMMTIWCEKVRGDQTGCTLNLHVSDMERRVVEGAHMELHYSLGTYEGGVYKDISGIINGTTNGQGAVTFDIEYPSIDPERPRLQVYGYVYHDDLKQRFEDTIQIQALPPIDFYGPYRLKAKVLNSLPLPLESSVTLEISILDDSNPLADTQVGYSVFTDHEVITSGTSTTDADGLFSATVVTPGIELKWGFGTSMKVRIGAEVDGWVEHVLVNYVCWHEMGPNFDWYDEGPLLEVEQDTPGGNLSVSLSDPEAGGSEEEAWFVWGLGPIDWDSDVTYESENWTRVSSMSLFGGMEAVPGVYNEGLYTAEIPIPDFVPNGSLLFVVGVTQSNEESGMVRRLAYVEGFSYSAVVEDSEDGTLETSMPDWYLWILVLIIVSVAVVGLLLVMRR